MNNKITKKMKIPSYHKLKKKFIKNKKKQKKFKYYFSLYHLNSKNIYTL